MIVDEEATDAAERAHDAEREARIKRAILLWLSKPSIERLTAAARGEVPSVSLHQLVSGADDEMLDGFYAAYFRHPPPALFMCTLKGIDNWHDAIHDVWSWLAKVCGVSIEQLGPIKLDLMHAPALRDTGET